MLKDKAANFFVNYTLSKRGFDEQSFSTIINDSYAFLILMPEDEQDFRYSLDVLTFLEELKKEIFILTYDYRISLLPMHYRSKAFGHGLNDINKINLPSKKMILKLLKNKFDVILDLNRKEQLFYSYIAGKISAKVRIGFTKRLADKTYNIQISNKETNLKISYKNLLNCLKML